MEQYVSWGRRSWTPLTKMDPMIHLSERHRSDMLLDLSGTTRDVSKSKLQSTMKGISTKVTDDLVSQHVFIFGSEEARKNKAKILIGFKKEENTATMENLERACLLHKLQLRRGPRSR